jgi:hypothetical protein
VTLQNRALDPLGDARPTPRLLGNLPDVWVEGAALDVRRERPRFPTAGLRDRLEVVLVHEVEEHPVHLHDVRLVELPSVATLAAKTQLDLVRGGGSPPNSVDDEVCHHRRAFADHDGDGKLEVLDQVRLATVAPGPVLGDGAESFAQLVRLGGGQHDEPLQRPVVRDRVVVFPEPEHVHELVDVAVPNSGEVHMNVVVTDLDAERVEPGLPLLVEVRERQLRVLWDAPREPHRAAQDVPHDSRPRR